MRKQMKLLLVIGILLFLCACGTPVPGNKTAPEGTIPDSEGGMAASSYSGKSPAVETAATQAEQESGSLSLLCNLQDNSVACATDSGYYYLSNDPTRLSDGRLAIHLMYMDAATHQEIYLCSNAACTHDTVDCTSVFLTDEFPPYSTLLFVWNDNLYIMSKRQDSDGSSAEIAAFGITGTAVESTPSILYRANPDGTNRNQVYAFDSTVTVEDFVIGDADGLYFITKKLTTRQSDGNSYQTSSERNLIYLDLSAKTETLVCSMDFGGAITWDVIGCSSRFLVLHGIDFGREVTPEEIHADDTAIYDDSFDVFATLDVDTCTLSEIYRVYAPKARSYVVGESKLYFSVHGSGSIKSVDLRTGKETTLCTIAQNSIWGMIDDKLYCYDSHDYTYYFIDVNTGKISHSKLVNKTTGWHLSIIAQIGGQILVNYDSEGSFSSDGSFHSVSECYGLIDKEDLYAGIDNFIPITMSGKGM